MSIQTRRLKRLNKTFQSPNQMLIRQQRHSPMCITIRLVRRMAEVPGVEAYSVRLPLSWVFPSPSRQPLQCTKTPVRKPPRNKPKRNLNSPTKLQRRRTQVDQDATMTMASSILRWLESQTSTETSSYKIRPKEKSTHMSTYSTALAETIRAPTSK